MRIHIAVTGITAAEFIMINNMLLLGQNHETFTTTVFVILKRN